MKKRKIVVAGAGYVGSAALYTLLTAGTADELVLLDINAEKAEGDVLDMRHGMSFLRPVTLYAGGTPEGYAHCADAALVILTAGAAQRPGETRLDLLERNLCVFDDVLEGIVPRLAPEAIILVVTNPVDVLTRYVLARSGLPPGRVIGSGTVLDTSRLKVAIAGHAGVDARDVHTFIVGEHGDTKVPVFSATTISGMRLADYCRQCAQCGGSAIALGRMHELHDEVRDAAYEVIRKKGATCYAVAQAVNRIAEAVLGDQKAILTVSGLVDGLHGIQGVCLSLPCVVGAGGLEKQLNVCYSDEEAAALRHS
ncbi:MAG: L-lactate dehydrogenase, partial [Oscillospiraceae bacterium]|nr:L-lactate dehydrogenase [Oscillospiraceae bacterium]